MTGHRKKSLSAYVIKITGWIIIAGLSPNPLRTPNAMYKLIFRLLIVMSSFIATACTWVKTSDAGYEVTLLSANRVSQCARIGSITTSTKSTLLKINRNPAKIQAELDALAREEAVKLQANSLVRHSIADGKATYTAYQCP